MSTKGFRDLFSAHAEEYARFRPSYPEELFQYLGSLCSERKLAWDCATGNGQAAVPLASVFERVIATDASEDQISHASLHPNVEYRVAHASASGLSPASVDLVCCAQAAHWFDLDAFYAEVRRVARPSGVVSLITYAIPKVDERIDLFLHAYANSVLGAFWPQERTHVDSGYSTLPFPFEEVVQPPAFAMSANWAAEAMLAYMGTWSATQMYMRFTGQDPRDAIAGELKERWGSSARPIVWKLAMRTGFVR